MFILIIAIYLKGRETDLSAGWFPKYLPDWGLAEAQSRSLKH